MPIVACDIKMRYGMSLFLLRQSAFLRRSPLAFNQAIQIGAHTGLNVTKTVAAQVFPTVPARHDNQVIIQLFALKHTDDHHACARFPIIALERPRLWQQDRPRIMGRFSVGFIALELF